MKWFLVERKSLADDFEDMLYDMGPVRQIRLPTLIGYQGRWKTLRVAVPSHVKEVRFQHVDTMQDFNRAIEEVCSIIPEHAEEIKLLPPGSEIGSLLVNRIGPACPSIATAAGNYICQARMKNQLSWVNGLHFFPAYCGKIVRLNWNLGEPVPREMIYYEPESYFLDGTHSPETAGQMENFHEIILPDQKWYEVGRGPKGARTVRIGFESHLPHRGKEYDLRYGLVEIEFDQNDGFPDKYPWVRLVRRDEGLSGAWDLISEDLCEILRGPGQWTLDFKEVNQF